MLTAMMLSQHRVSSRTIRLRTPYHAQSRLWGMLIRRGLRFVQWRGTRNPIKERDPIVHGQIKSHFCWGLILTKTVRGQAHFNRPDIGNV